MKTVFTTGEAAKICKVSQQTIIRCFDNGQLKGFRVPGSRFRRIPREALYKFMKDNGIPTDALESGKRKVLLVDDDAELVELMTKVLEDDGRFEVRVANNGFDAGMLVKEFRPDLVVLDVLLPDLDGLDLARRLRDGRRIPVIFLTAKDATEDKLAGLDVGDDYVTKPFSLAEMVARVRTVLRRTRAGEEGVLRFDDVVLSEDTHEVWRAGRLVELTPTEFNLLRFFMLNPRRVLTKAQILGQVWDADVGDPNVVETYVSYLRRKLNSLGPPLIETVRLVGYALRSPRA